MRVWLFLGRFLATPSSYIKLVRAAYKQRIYYYLIQFSGKLHCWLQRYHTGIKTLGSSLVSDVFLCFCHFYKWWPGSIVVLDCIDFRSLPSSLHLYFKMYNRVKCTHFRTNALTMHKFHILQISYDNDCKMYDIV